MVDRADIIRMAREAGILHATDTEVAGLMIAGLKCFAESVIADFLQRTGQYLTNDASREAAIADAVAAATAPLQARIAAMEGMQAPTAEDIESQDWAQVDGATAWHLVHRHAEDWAHTARLMHAWRDAAVAAAVEAEREAIRARGQRG
ncbi:polyprotein [Acidovorax phage AP1]|nr:polyprotein [Acidovorax phage AP1]